MHQLLSRSLQEEMAQLLPPNAGHFGLMGIVGAVGLASFLNLLLPLKEPYALLGLLCLGYAALFRNRNSVPGIFSALALAVLFAFVLLASLVAIASAGIFDTSLYHLPTIYWARLYPIPLGLANLAPYLSYNSSWFVLEGALFWKAGDLATVYSLNAVLVSFFFQSFFLSLRDSLSSWRERYFSLALLIACFLVANYLAWTGNIGPNAATSLFSVYAWFFVLRFFETKLPLGAILAFGLACFALTAKLFALPVALAAGIVALFSWWTHRRESQVFLFRYRSVILFFAAFGCLWLVRALATSGCLLYPQASTCFPSLPWASSLDRVAALGQLIQERNGGALYAYFKLKQPLAVVLKEASRALTTPFARKAALVAVPGILLLLVSWLKHRGKPSLHAWKVLVFGLLAQVAGVLFWTAVTSQAERFGLHYLLIGGALILGIGLSTVDRMPKNWSYLPHALLALTFFLVPRTLLKTASEPLRWTNWPEYLNVMAERRTTASGQVVFESLHCYDTPPPCTHDFDAGISYVPRPGGSFIFYRK